MNKEQFYQKMNAILDYSEGAELFYNGLHTVPVVNLNKYQPENIPKSIIITIDYNKLGMQNITILDHSIKSDYEALTFTFEYKKEYYFIVSTKGDYAYSEAVKDKTYLQLEKKVKALFKEYDNPFGFLKSSLQYLSPFLEKEKLEQKIAPIKNEGKKKENKLKI